jgi:elongation factor P hydroxylase
MDKLLFDAKCSRCDIVSEIDFIKRFGEVETKDIAENWLFKSFEGFVHKCEICNIETIFRPVTLIK